MPHFVATSLEPVPLLLNRRQVSISLDGHNAVCSVGYIMYEHYSWVDVSNTIVTFLFCSTHNKDLARDQFSVSSGAAHEIKLWPSGVVISFSF